MKLESYLTGPNGGLTKRCQATANATKQQCARPASDGYDVCTVHGAGKRTRVARGERKTPGRPVQHGRYARDEPLEVAELIAELRQLEMDLDNSDEELLLLKATIQWLLNQNGKFAAQLEQVETLMSEAIPPLVKGITDPKEMLETLGKFAAAARLIPAIQGYADKLGDHAYRVIGASKIRAETKAKLAETKALEQLVVLTQCVRGIIHDIVDDPEKLGVFEDRLDREVFGPNRLEKPDLLN
jgi:hypothetical protein